MCKITIYTIVYSISVKQQPNKDIRTFSFWDPGKMAAMLETSQLRSIPELSEQSHADFSSLIPLQWHRSPGIGYWIPHLSLSNTFSLCLSHYLTSWAVFHVDHNGTRHSAMHDPSPCASLKIARPWPLYMQTIFGLQMLCFHLFFSASRQPSTHKRAFLAAAETAGH